MAQFIGEAGAEASGTLPNGEEWRVKFDASGKLSVKDPNIEAALVAAADHPDSGIKVK